MIVEWAPFDWVEEDTAVTGHPHDPFKRIDVLPSSRHVVVSSGGTVLADTTRAVALYETGLPVRWYVPRDDVRLDLLEPSDATSVCAYKGQATYFSLRRHGDDADAVDIAWTYVDPLHEAAASRTTCASTPSAPTSPSTASTSRAPTRSGGRAADAELA